MNDHEMLNFAAAAVGYNKDKVHKVYWLSAAGGSVFVGNAWRNWNSLTSGNDALELAVMLKLDLMIRHGAVGVKSADGKFDGHFWENFDEDADSVDTRKKATYRVITRAAAQIGKNLLQNNFIL